MEEPLHISEVIDKIESEMVRMWAMDEAVYVIKKDPEYIAMVLTAVYYEKDHFRALGMEVGEA